MLNRATLVAKHREDKAGAKEKTNLLLLTGKKKLARSAFTGCRGQLKNDLRL